MRIMEPPAKRQCISNEQLTIRRIRNDQRLKSRFESIFDKFTRDFTGIGDEIDIATGEVIINNGHLLTMRNEQDVEGDVQGEDELGGGMMNDSLVTPLRLNKANSTSPVIKKLHVGLFKSGSARNKLADDDLDDIFGIGLKSAKKSPKVLRMYGGTRTERPPQRPSGLVDESHKKPAQNVLKHKRPLLAVEHRAAKPSVMFPDPGESMRDPKWSVPEIPEDVFASRLPPEPQLLDPEEEIPRSPSPCDESLWAIPTGLKRGSNSGPRAFKNTTEKAKQPLAQKCLSNAKRTPPNKTTKSTAKSSARVGNLEPTKPSPDLEPGKRWTQEEDEMLRQLRTTTSLTWRQTAELLPGRLVASIQKRWYLTKNRDAEAVLDHQGAKLAEVEQNLEELATSQNEVPFQETQSTVFANLQEPRCAPQKPENLRDNGQPSSIGQRLAQGTLHRRKQTSEKLLSKQKAVESKAKLPLEDLESKSFSSNARSCSAHNQKMDYWDIPVTPPRKGKSQSSSSNTSISKSSRNVQVVIEKLHRPAREIAATNVSPARPAAITKPGKEISGGEIFTSPILTRKRAREEDANTEKLLLSSPTSIVLHQTKRQAHEALSPPSSTLPVGSADVSLDGYLDEENSAAYEPMSAEELVVDKPISPGKPISDNCSTNKGANQAHNRPRIPQRKDFHPVHEVRPGKSGVHGQKRRRISMTPKADSPKKPTNSEFTLGTSPLTVWNEATKMDIQPEIAEEKPNNHLPTTVAQSAVLSSPKQRSRFQDTASRRLKIPSKNSNSRQYTPSLKASLKLCQKDGFPDYDSSSDDGSISMPGKRNLPTNLVLLRKSVKDRTPLQMGSKGQSPQSIYTTRMAKSSPVTSLMSSRRKSFAGSVSRRKSTTRTPKTKTPVLKNRLSISAIVGDSSEDELASAPKKPLSVDHKPLPQNRWSLS